MQSLPTQSFNSSTVAVARCVGARAQGTYSMCMCALGRESARTSMSVPCMHTVWSGPGMAVYTHAHTQTQPLSLSRARALSLPPTHTHTHTRTRTHTSTQTRSSECTYTHINTHAHARTHAHTHTHTHARAYTRMHIYTYTHPHRPRTPYISARLLLSSRPPFPPVFFSWIPYSLDCFLLDSSAPLQQWVGFN